MLRFTICQMIGEIYLNKKRIVSMAVFCLAFSLVFSFSVFVCVAMVQNMLGILFFVQDDFSSKAESIGTEVEIEQTEELLEKEPVELPEIKKTSLGEFRLTAYCSCEQCCGIWAKNRPLDENGNEIVYGASGAVLVAGKSVAVDPSVIPYGSEIEIGGEKYRADDCGGAIKGNRIDVYFDDHQSALEFAVKKEELFLIG